MKAVLFDMDGVLYNSRIPIPGAVEVIRWCRAKKIPHLFVTNTSSRARSGLVQKLQSFGIDATEAEILTPLVAAAKWLRSHGNGSHAALFISPAARQEFENIACISEDAESGAGYVVIGDLGERWDFKTLNRAFRLLHSNPEAVLLALGMTRLWQADDGLRLDVAPFVAALEHASRRQALVMGKPARPFFEAAVEILNLPSSEIAMIGDDIEADIQGAQEAGMKGILVRTGKFREPDLAIGITPDASLGSIAELPQWWEAHAMTHPRLKASLRTPD